MQRAFDQLECSEINQIVIDGNINYLSNLPKTKAIIKADGLIPAVSAASIIAKVARDKYMMKLSRKYPTYGFEKHVGYGTKFHHEALVKYGITDQHRVNYKPIKVLLV